MLPFGDVCSIYHVYRFDLGGEFLLSPCVRRVRFFVVFLDERLFPLMFGVKLTGMFNDPTISIGMIGRLVRGAMNLARPI